MLTYQVEQIKCFEIVRAHGEMDEVRLTKKVMNSRRSGKKPRGRPRYIWSDGVKKALNDRELMTVDEARVCARERNEWREVVNA